jgi:Cdc6-like AAA superfamily ATPase
MDSNALKSPEVEKFVVALEEAARANSSAESIRFIEPASGTLSRALANRSHLIFGRRGSGKTSLLLKTRAEMLVQRRPNAYIDMEKFKGHTYPDVLISVLIETFENIRSWLDEGAIAPASKKSFWHRMRVLPSRSPLQRTGAARLSSDLASHIAELEALLYAQDDAEIETLHSKEFSGATGSKVKARAGAHGLGAGFEGESNRTSSTGEQETEKTRRSKVEFLQRRVMLYQKTLREVVGLSGNNGFIMLDDLYYIRRNNQADVLDYFHRLFKGTGLWIKVGTIRHRSSWYRHGDPPVGVKLGDDIEEIDLDLSLEKYRTAKQFLLRVAGSVGDECKVKVNQLLTRDARDRLVLASGGVARDFLSIMRKAIAFAQEQSASKVGAISVNQAAGELESSKRDEFSRDAVDGQQKLQEEFDRVSQFCLIRQKTNCFLVEKDYTDDPAYHAVRELVDLRLIHAVASRITVRTRPGRIYEAYMIDISQYTGERKRRNLKIIEFWKPEGKDELRLASRIYAEKAGIAEEDI